MEQTIKDLKVSKPSISIKKEKEKSGPKNQTKKVFELKKQQPNDDLKDKYEEQAPLKNVELPNMNENENDE